MNRQTRQAPAALHVLFLAGRAGVAARLAAQWTRMLAGNGVDVDALDAVRVDRAPAASRSRASLVVVIHAPGEPPPLVVHHCGGRVDWHLQVDALTGKPAEFAAELLWHVTRLLGDLGLSQAALKATAAQAARPAVIDFPLPAKASTFGSRVPPGALAA